MRLGVDLGGTKIVAAALGRDGREVARRRVPTPKSGYDAALEVLARLILDVEEEAGERCSVGIGMPGAVSPRSGRVFNAYNTPYNGRALKRDLEARLGRELRFANDGNCFALSEALDGAAAGAEVVFGATFGTGVGGGLVVRGQVIEGRNRLTGEWGHVPLPWMRPDEFPGHMCFCGRAGCLDQMCSGPALARLKEETGNEETAMLRYEDRLARAFGMLVNFLDPDVIVVGGGVSNEDRILANVPRLLPAYVYSDNADVRIVRARHGDASGVRGAAMLWPPS
jgi:fructokinase